MKFRDLEKKGELRQIQFLTAMTVFFYWPWYFLFREMSPDVSEDLLGRVLISTLSSFIFIYSKDESHCHERLKFYFHTIITMALLHHCSLLGSNNWSYDYRIAYLVATSVLAANVINFSNYVWLSAVALLFPLFLYFFTPPSSTLSFIFFTLSNATVLLVVGFLMRSNFKYRRDLVISAKNVSLSAKLAALGQMAAGIAHEINSPLAVIKGKSDLILMKTVSDGPIDREWLRGELGKIGSTVETISKIVRGMRSFARNSEQDPFATLELKNWIQNTLALSQDRISHHEITLEIDPIPNVAVQGRESQLIQVLMNLLNNSVDALESSSKKMIKISFELVSDKLKILIFDSGPGISKDLQSKLTEPFYTTKAPGKGTGLGLSISRGIMEAHKGSLAYLPSANMTCFCLEISQTALLLEKQNLKKAA